MSNWGQKPQLIGTSKNKILEPNRTRTKNGKSGTNSNRRTWQSVDPLISKVLSIFTFLVSFLSQLLFLLSFQLFRLLFDLRFLLSLHNSFLPSISQCRFFEFSSWFYIGSLIYRCNLQLYRFYQMFEKSFELVSFEPGPNNYCFLQGNVFLSVNGHI